jgi:ligand-binding sensor domain-containing protein
MNYKLISTVVCLFIFIICTNFATAQKLKFKHITPDEGLSSSSVNSIIQDHKGFIWIATYDGLNRYDGFDFVIYKKSIRR